MTARSRWTRSPTDGRCTLTTTSVPSSSVARWTWAIDAAATGVRSKVAKVVGILRPSSSSTTRCTTGHGSAGTWSRHFLNSVTTSSGKMPSPDERICPSLM